ncbi:MAG: M24 family metallopeptidase, partial [Candidatus Hodarchaeales archaeon]
GHPEDATLFLDVKNRMSTLIPCDYQLALSYSEADRIINIEEYGGLVPATIDVFADSVSSNAKIGVTGSIPYSEVKSIKETVPKCEIIFNPASIDSLLDGLRATKSPFEISEMKKSIKISNQIVEEIKESLNNKNKIQTEMDLAVFVESRMRELGAFGVGFETLVASSARSWQIHTYPRADPNQSIYRPGLALIDFGVKGTDLTSDVTLPFIMGSMNKKMKTIVETVQQAHNEAIDALSEVEFLHEVAKVAVKIIEEQGFHMPHSLGHGIGLTIHDSPKLRLKPKHKSLLKSWVPTKIEEGMIITIEPGIYEKDVGGFRLENDVLITKNGPQVLTNSEPVFIDLA